jgi:hypothetical protein
VNGAGKAGVPNVSGDLIDGEARLRIGPSDGRQEHRETRSPTVLFLNSGSSRQK